jgi:hypothetical protein
MVVALIISITSLVKSFFQLSDDSAISIAISTVESFGLIISLIIAVRQLIDSKEIARATFIIELNKSFVENDDYLDLYNKLQSCFDGSCPCGQKCGARYDIGIECKVDVLKGQISNYLTFFETVYLLYRNGVISFEVLDDLFAYRFFLAVHSKVVQQKKLKVQPHNFKNIYCLEYEWLKWRKEHGKDKDNSVETVYNRLLLKDLVGADEYANLTEGCKK